MKTGLGKASARRASNGGNAEVGSAGNRLAAPSNQAMQRILGSGGSPLDAAPRASAEAGLGMGLGDVRVHRGATADEATRGLSARAFTVGNHIVLGSSSDSASLAHELIHVAQQDPRLTSSDARGESAENEAEGLAPALAAGGKRVAPRIRVGPGIHRQAVPGGDEPVTFGPPSFLAAFVEVSKLTNGQLNEKAIQVDEWLHSHAKTLDPDVGEYWKLAKKLRAERQLRVAAGHFWMIEAGSVTPKRLIGLKQGPEFYTIIDVDVAMALGPPTNPGMAIMTEEQFQTFLSAHGVEVTELDDYPETDATDGTGAAEGLGSDTSRGSPDTGLSTYGFQPAGIATTLGGGVDPKDAALGKVFGTSPHSTQWTCRMGEASYQGSSRSAYGIGLTALNEQGWIDYQRNIEHPPGQRNYAGMDFQRTTGPAAKILGVVRISSKTSLTARLARQRYYREGLGAIFKGSGIDHYLSNQPEMEGIEQGSAAYEAARRKILSQSFIVVNEDDVAPTQKALKDAKRKWKYPSYRDIYEGVLSLNPQTVQTAGGPVTLRTLADIDGLAGVSQESIDAIKSALGEKAARMVKGNATTTPDLSNLNVSRKAIPAGFSEEQIGALSSGSYINWEKNGVKAAGKAGLRGGGLGALIAVITQGGIMVFYEADHPNWEVDLAEAMGIGAATAFVGGATYETVVAQGSKYALSGKSTWFAADMPKTGGIVKTTGRLATSTVLGAGFELISMGFEDRPHSTPEILTRTGRSIGINSASSEVGSAFAVIFGAGETGAIGGGTAGFAPGAVIGFIVGLAAGAVSYYFLDAIIPGGQEDWEAPPPGSVTKGMLQSKQDRLLMAEESDAVRSQLARADNTLVRSGGLPDKVPGTAKVSKSVTKAMLLERLAREQTQRDMEAAENKTPGELFAVPSTTKVHTGVQPLPSWIVDPLLQEKSAMKNLTSEGTPYAGGVDEEAIPAGFGLRLSEQQLLQLKDR